jgi:TolB-like protein
MLANLGPVCGYPKLIPSPYEAACNDFSSADGGSVGIANVGGAQEPRSVRFMLHGNMCCGVSKDELIDKVWAGRIVSESTLTSRINAARNAVGDSGAAQRLIRTSARKGFRFVGNVSLGAAAATPAKTDSRAAKAVLAVRPFATSGDGEAAALSLGLVDSIMTGLARFRLVAAVSRAADDEAATYTLNGVVQRAGDAVRISAHLIDRHDGAQLWAERYDRSLDSSFAVQDEIAQAIIAGIEQPWSPPRIAAARPIRQARPPTLKLRLRKSSRS